MAYEKNVWVDHVEDPVTGDIVQEGTKFTAARGNKIETGIAEAHQFIDDHEAINVDQSEIPTGSTGSIKQLFSRIVNRIKAITGKTNWYDAPATTLESAKNHMDDAVKHITAAERNAWEGKQNALGYTPVNKTGDTMTGRLAISLASDSAQLKLERTGTAAGVSWLGTVNGDFVVLSEDLSQAFKVWDASQLRINYGRLEFDDGGVWKRVSAPMKTQRLYYTETVLQGATVQRTLIDVTGAGRLDELFMNWGSYSYPPTAKRTSIYVDGTLYGQYDGSGIVVNSGDGGNLGPVIFFSQSLKVVVDLGADPRNGYDQNFMITLVWAKEV